MKKRITRAHIRYWLDYVMSRGTVAMTLLLAGEEYPLIQWDSGDVGANENRIGPTVNFILPDVDATQMTLRLDAGEASSEYRLCYRSRTERRVSRQLNV